MVGRVATLPPEDLEQAYRTYAYDVRPVSDDAPFFWHFARFRDVLGDLGRLRELVDHTRGMGELSLLVMLAVSTAMASLFLLLPFLAVRERWLRLPRKASSTLYFAALGLGFMFFEIALIQKLTLLLGYPTYTLSVTLFTLLLTTGAGSFLSERRPWLARSPRRAIAILFALTLYYQFGLDALARLLAGLPLGVRIAAAGLSMAPLGFTVGGFLPLGLSAVALLSPFRREYVAWGWAANGLFSVIGSLLAAVISMSWGFRVLLGAGFALYALAAALLAALRCAGGGAAAFDPSPGAR
jgi:hypothetical protein